MSGNSPCGVDGIAHGARGYEYSPKKARFGFAAAGCNGSFH